MNKPVSGAATSSARLRAAPPGGRDRLPGSRVLVVEDDWLIGMLLEDMLDDLGCTTLGPMARLGTALDFVEQRAGDIDAVTLDVDLAGELSFPIAERLDAASIPFVLATSQDRLAIDPRWRDRPLLRKPFSPAQLEDALRDALGAAA